MGRASQVSREVRERAVRLVLERQAEHESERAAIGSIDVKLGCSAEALRKGVLCCGPGRLSAPVFPAGATPSSC
jgi:transposase-like protein